MNYIFFKLVSILCFNAKNEDAFNRFIELEKTNFKDSFFITRQHLKSIIFQLLKSDTYTNKP